MFCFEPPFSKKKIALKKKRENFFVHNQFDVLDTRDQNINSRAFVDGGTESFGIFTGLQILQSV